MTNSKIHMKARRDRVSVPRDEEYWLEAQDQNVTRIPPPLPNQELKLQRRMPLEDESIGMYLPRLSISSGRRQVPIPQGYRHEFPIERKAPQPTWNSQTSMGMHMRFGQGPANPPSYVRKEPQFTSTWEPQIEDNFQIAARSGSKQHLGRYTRVADQMRHHGHNTASWKGAPACEPGQSQATWQAVQSSFRQPRESVPSNSLQPFRQMQSQDWQRPEISPSWVCVQPGNPDEQFW
eukprot:CAMPEP_0184490716 /NCGR_PEP_ID=MMETSP0113_2-20130426/18624_1 /TAXON_ID=91329 /ORGANISM="Norrisiella sphaerica, Strain BC52" /LENGTH=234 /DNA_ID=CAMNT_0026874731 /DNA_START=255 /DNA_END=956 /DNA_ORIENTATION=-